MRIIQYISGGHKQVDTVVSRTTDEDYDRIVADLYNYRLLDGSITED